MEAHDFDPEIAWQWPWYAPRVAALSLFGELFGDGLMETSFPLVIEWPNGTHLPVRVAASATGHDLMKLLQFAGFRNRPFVLVAAGGYVDPKVELSQQMVHHHSVIRVVPVSAVAEDSDPPPHVFDAVYAEMLRLFDLQFSLLEGHRAGALLYGSLLNDGSDTVETHSKRGTTICPLPATSVSTQPLPPPPRDSESDIPDSEWENESIIDRPIFEPNRVHREWRW
jgi:hypothetical protein